MLYQLSYLPEPACTLLSRGAPRTVASGDGACKHQIKAGHQLQLEAGNGDDVLLLGDNYALFAFYRDHKGCGLTNCQACADGHNRFSVGCCDRGCAVASDGLARRCSTTVT